MEKIDIGSITIDFDSTVITRYGEQEGRNEGYNPIISGQNSHHPLMAFISQTRMVANACLRPEDTATGSNCINFMEETFEHCLQSKKVSLVRADSGFYIEDTLQHLKSKKLNYIIAVRMYPTIKSEIHSRKEWIV